MSYKFNPFTGNFDMVDTSAPFVPPATTVLYVDKSRTDDYAETGIQDYPFKTIQAAIDAATLFPSVICIYPGTYDEDVVIHNVNNLLLLGASGPDSPLTQIKSVTTSGTSTRIRLQDLKVYESLNFEDTENRHTLINVSATEINISDSLSRWMVFRDIFCDTDITLQGNPTVPVTVYVHGQKSNSCNLIIEGDNYICYVDGDSRFNSVDHLAGKLYLNNVLYVLDRIESTASAPNGLLVLGNVNLQKPDMTYALLDKTGDCDYVIGQINRVGNETLNGTRLNYSQLSADIAYSNVVSGLTAVNVQDAIDELAANAITSQTKIEYVTLDGTDIANGYVILSETPLSQNDVALDVIGGGPQFLADDFSVVGNQLKFEGNLAQGGLSALTAGDKLRIIYVY